ncbi:MAG: hypothetical protein INR71_08520 [Terriglobus roseus]|nr:hypothetical protein [Terriglobus roseus]
MRLLTCHAEGTCPSTTREHARRTRHHLTTKQLLGIRLGPGAAVLPKDIYRINLTFAPRIEGGHMGAR